jgi:membrane dipeptidase
MNFPVFDFHCDTALALLGDNFNQAGKLRKNQLHVDLERASKLGGYAQCFACFTTPMMEEQYHVSPVVMFERELATIQREVDQNSDLISIAYSPADIRANQEAGKMSAILTLEGTAGFGHDPALRIFHLPFLCTAPPCKGHSCARGKDLRRLSYGRF